MIGIFSFPRILSQAPKDDILVSQGTLGLSTNPYLKVKEGGTYRLLCPLRAVRDRNRRYCFDERIWKMKNARVVVGHGRPIRGGVNKVVVCDVTDERGKTLLRPGWATKCK